MGRDLLARAKARPLSEAERELFAECEAYIQEHLPVFLEVGRRLLIVRDRYLYREGFPTFAAYLEGRWNLNERQAYHWMAASRAWDNIAGSEPARAIAPPDQDVQTYVVRRPEQTVQPVEIIHVVRRPEQTVQPVEARRVEPTHEYQLRPLVNQPPDVQRAAWDLASERAGGTPSHGDVQRAVADVTGRAPRGGEVPIARATPGPHASRPSIILYTDDAASAARQLREAFRGAKWLELLDHLTRP
jgi:hypothetical protein